MLVIVEHGNIEAGPKSFLNLEAPWSRDVLQVDPTKGGGDSDDGFDDFIDSLRLESDREGVNPSKLLEEHRLALHDRHRRERPQVAEAEDRRAV